MRGVRGGLSREEHDQRRIDNRKRFKTIYTDVGRDSTRISRLTRDEVELLHSRLKPTFVNTHNLSDEFSKYWCHETTGYRGEYGHPAASYLPFSEKNWRHQFSPLMSFQYGAVVMAMDGTFATDKKDEVSHLCNNGACVRREHICWENRKDNERRKGCCGDVVCDCCNTIKLVCKHNPRCVIIKK